jgi:hypothetical protein
LLEAILTMIGYYLVILTAAMVIIMVVVQIFKAIVARREHNKPSGPVEDSDVRVEERSEELAAVAIAAVSCMLGAEKPLGISAWSRVEGSTFSPWKIASKSRPIPRGGG